MSLPAYICLFFVVSFVGWAFESVYAVFAGGKWERRGFLYSPVCPIYGLGVVAIIVAVRLIDNSGAIALTWWQVFLLSFFGSAVLEYVTSVALEKLFHAYWWDYSNLPFNINGRVCLPAATLFGLGGLFSVYVVYPLWIWALSFVPSIVIEVLAFGIVAWLAADITLTVSALSDFATQVASIDEAMTRQMGELVDNAVAAKRNATEAAQEKVRNAGDTLSSAKDNAKKNFGGAVEKNKAAFDAAASRMAYGMSDSYKNVIMRAKGFTTDSLRNARTKVEEARKRPLGRKKGK